MTIKEFLATSYTSYHSTQNAVKLLEENGFQKLTFDSWKIEQGGKYYITQNDSCVVAFKVGKNKRFALVNSHTDSPSFRVKGGSVVTTEKMCRLNTEKYGGGILYTYFDRPLKIAGRILYEENGKVVSKTTESQFNVVIPSLCIHHNPTVNDGFSVNAQVDTLPLVGLENIDLYKELSGGKNVLDADLFVVPSTEPFVAGVNDELLCSPRIDNLTSVYTSINALITSNSNNICICACFDNEEIGSSTRQGAESEFLTDVIKCIEESLGFSNVESADARAKGFVLSVDNGHAVHPAHTEKSDIVCRVHMGDGIVIKHHTNYATDGLSGAVVKNILGKNGVKYQDYYNNSAIRCGSTIGNTTACKLSMRVCDIGLGQLAMHSACETVAKSDIDEMQKGLTAFYNTDEF